MTGDVEKRTVFILDDDPVVRMLLTETLTVFGYAVQAFPSWKEAKTAMDLDAGKSCAVFMVDLIMPDTNGFSVIEELRKTYQDRLPIILLSANADRSVTERAKAPGLNPNAILEKPWSPTQLRDTIATAIANAPK